MTDLLEPFSRAIVKYGGAVERMADRASAASYALKLARRAPSPHVVIDPRAQDPAWSQASDVTVSPLDDTTDLRARIYGCQVGVGVIDHAIADSGQAVVTSSGEAGRLLAFLSPIYVGLLWEADLVPTFAGLLEQLQPRLGELPVLTFMAGPSASADIEHIVNRGMHGPQELHILVLAGARP